MREPHKLRSRGLKVFHKGLILVAAPLALELILIGSLAWLLLESDKESLLEARYRRCASIGAKLISLSNDAVIMAFGCYQNNTEFFLQVYDSDRKKIEQRKVLLLAAAKGDLMAEKAAKQLVDSLNDLAPILDRVVLPAKQGKRLFEITGPMKEIQKEFSSKRDINMERMSSVTHLQEKIAAAASKRRAQLQKLQFLILSIGLAANIIVGILLMCFYRTAIVGRLKIIMENTLAIAEARPLKSPLDGTDEIARLDDAFHSMDRDLKLAAERERALFENASDIICVLDSELKFSKINPACKRLWGYEPEALLDKSVLELISENEREEKGKLFQQARDEGDMRDLELTVAQAGAGRSETLWSTYYAKSEDLLYCIVHDISERKQIERSKQAFITMLSSDLRQPLLAVSENLERLLGPIRKLLNEKMTTRLEQVRSNIVRLLDLVNDLLTLSQSQSNTLESIKEDCRISELLERSWQNLEGLAQKKQISVQIDCPDLSVYADPGKIIQVLINLGSNAIKFSPEKELIEITASRDGDFIEVCISDRGRGVPESHREIIFEKFKQVENADGKRKTGTGLGLPICKTIIEEHGGHIGVRSNSSNGSTFWFCLPANQQVYKDFLAERSSLEEKKELICRNLPESAIIQLTRVHPGTSFTLTQKGLLLIGIPIVFELIFVSSIWSVLTQTEKSRQEELRQRQINTCAYQLLDSYFTNSLIIVRSKSFENWLLYDQISTEIITAGKQLKKLVGEDKSLRDLYLPIEKIQKEMVERIEKGRSIMNQGYTRERAEAATMDRFEIWAKAASISRRLGKLIDESEKKEFNNPRKQERLRREQGILLLAALAANIALSLFLARFFSKDITSRLALQADNASRLARNKSLNPVLSGKDEIARLDEAFHESAAKLAEARKRERAIFDNSKDIICVLDGNARFLSINPAAESLLNCTQDELLDSTLYDFCHSQDRELLNETIAGDLKEGKLVELKLRSQNNWLDVLLSLSRTPAQENIYCIAHDISARKELEQMKQDFLSVVSHDLRSPLTSMTGTVSFIEMGGAGEVPEQAQPYLHEIVMACEGLIDLITDFLDLEKLQAGKMQLSLSALSASEILEEVYIDLKATFPELTVDLLDMSDDPLIDAEEERLKQALSYLLNFIAAQLAGDATLKIAAETKDGQLSWRIIDTGKALRLDADRILFESLDTSKLTLPLCRSIIEAHGGQLHAYRDQNNSKNIFEITLPLSKRSLRNNESGQNNGFGE